MAQIKLTVVITTYNARATVARCLSSLQEQTLRTGFEIILVDSSTDGTADLVTEQFPEVALYTFSERMFCGDARNYGISQARGGIIAFIDADCIADPNWAEEILAAHQSDYPLIGGAVANGNQESYVGWAHYFCEFNQWMPQAKYALVDEVPGCVLSLKRWAFDRYGPFIEQTYCSDSAFHWKMASDGHRALFVPSIKISHLNINSATKFLRHEIQHGKNFGTVRKVEQRLSRPKQVAHALFSPLLPLLLFLRAARRAATTGTYLKQFVRSAPLVLLGQMAWSYGEFLGYISKPE